MKKGAAIDALKVSADATGNAPSLADLLACMDPKEQESQTPRLEIEPEVKPEEKEIPIPNDDLIVEDVEDCLQESVARMIEGPPLIPPPNVADDPFDESLLSTFARPTSARSLGKLKK